MNGFLNRCFVWIEAADVFVFVSWFPSCFVFLFFSVSPSVFFVSSSVGPLLLYVLVALCWALLVLSQLAFLFN
jgi:hypothetical protein